MKTKALQPSLPWKTFVGAWVVAILSLAVVYFTQPAHFPLETRDEWIEPRFDVSSQTLTEHEQTEVVVKAQGKMPLHTRDLEPAYVAIPSLGIQKEIPVGDLYKGVPFSLKAGRPADTEIKIKSKTFSTTIPITIASTQSLEADSVRIWRLTAGEPVLGLQGRFEIPLRLQLHTVRDNEVIPNVANADFVFVLRNVTANETLGKLILPKGNALSDAIWLAIEPDGDTKLVATSAEEETNPLTVSWDRNGPALSIMATPPDATAFATFRTRANIGVYLTYKGRLVPAPYNTAVIASSPPAMTLSPASPIAINPKSTITTLDVFSTAFGQSEGTVTFTEPRTGSSANVNVSFIFPWTYYLIALLSGPFGALFAERRNLSAMSGFDIGKCVLFGALTGLLLYMAALAGWSVVTNSAVVLVGLPSAVLLGFVGGVSGDLVVTLLTGAVLPAPK